MVLGLSQAPLKDGSNPAWGQKILPSNNIFGWPELLRFISTQIIGDTRSEVAGSLERSALHKNNSIKDNFYRRELKPWGIKCCIFNPGFFSTPLTRILPKLAEEDWKNLDEHQKIDYGEHYKNKSNLLSSLFSKYSF